MTEYKGFMGEKWAKFHTTPSKTRWGNTSHYEKYWWISESGKVHITYNYRPDESWPVISPIGGHANRRYLAISINDACEKYIHRLVARFFVKNDDPENFGVVHHCDHDKFNNHYTNLVWTDHRTNLRLAREHKAALKLVREHEQGS